MGVAGVGPEDAVDGEGGDEDELRRSGPHGKQRAGYGVSGGGRGRSGEAMEGVG